MALSQPDDQPIPNQSTQPEKVETEPKKRPLGKNQKLIIILFAFVLGASLLLSLLSKIFSNNNRELAPSPSPAITPIPIIHEITIPQPATEDLILTSMDLRARLRIPPDSYVGEASFSLWEVTILRQYPGIFRPIEVGTDLKLLDWIQPHATTLSGFRFTKSADIALNYKDISLDHVHEAQITVFKWDKKDSKWQKLSTTLDTNTKNAISKVFDLGEYQLMAPLICEADTTEIDDASSKAKSLQVNSDPASRAFDNPNDQDWFLFTAIKDMTYKIETANLASDVDTLITFFDSDANTLISTNDDVGSSQHSEILWKADKEFFDKGREQTFFIQAKPAPESTTGCEATYQISISTLK